MAQVRALVSEQAAIKSHPTTNRLIRDSSWTLILNGATLVANLITGVLIARVLGSAGRGQLTAIAVAPQLVGWIFATGCSQAVSYHQARHPNDAGRLLASWAIILIPLSIGALLFGEHILPTVLSAQNGKTVHLAQIYMLIVLCVVASDLIYGVLVGDGDFLFFNMLKFAQPAAIAVMYFALWRSRLLTVESALIASVLPVVVALAIATVRVLRRHRICKPSWHLGLNTFRFGLKAHGATISDLLNSRLDIMIIPAFLAASSVGVYAVAATLSGLVITVASALSVVVLPVAARSGERGSESVNRLIRISFILALAFGILLAAIAPLGVRMVYGPSFEESVQVVWLLLPGTILYASASVLRPALYGANQPLAASASYGLGLVITFLGLMIFLRRGGVFAAAIVSSAAYCAVFVASLFLYSHLAHVRVSELIPDRSDFTPVRQYGVRMWASTKRLWHKRG